MVTGILAGLIAPLFMAAIWVVSTLVFQPADGAASPIHGLPA
ncbi:MAG TPA: hypothetical protein VII71_00730 [Verrucomicrobiae bacterium]